MVVYKALPYDYAALQPAISDETMHFHHDKHYKTYVDNLNGLINDKPEFDKMTVENIIKKASKNRLDYKDILNNAGGVYNHEAYFESMRPYGACRCFPSEKLLAEILRSFESVENLLSTMYDMAVKLFGSGYVWLSADEDNKVLLASYANQDTPLPQGLKPLLPIDVWEHAYYLDYQNRRKEYVSNWMNLINWDVVNYKYLENK